MNKLTISIPTGKFNRKTKNGTLGNGEVSWGAERIKTLINKPLSYRANKVRVEVNIKSMKDVEELEGLVKNIKLLFISDDNPIKDYDKAEMMTDEMLDFFRNNKVKWDLPGARAYNPDTSAGN